MLGLRLLALTTLLFVSCTLAQAQTIYGAEISVQVLTYDDPAAPILVSEIYTSRIGAGPEFGLGPEGHPFVDIVPVTLDIGDGGVTLSYDIVGRAGGFTQANFNGYILTVSPCSAIIEPQLVQADAIALTPDRISAVENQLFINVAGLAYQPQTRIAIGFKLAACPVS
ncbi:MAG: hypothetical protein AAGA70_07445 [Pseudomonadota bacterium]